MLANHPPVAQLTSPRSLVISPNPDALLEHEERVRGQIAESLTQSPSVSHLAVAVARPNLSFPVGLPPPPRGTRQPKCPRLSDREGMASPTLTGLDSNSFQLGRGQTERASVEGLINSSSTTNPYINPAPMLGRLGHVKGQLGDVEEVGEEEGSGGEEREADVSEMEGCDGARRVGTGPSYGGAEGDSLGRRPRAASQRSHFRAVSLLVDKRMDRCRNILDLFSDSVPRPTARDGHLKRALSLRPPLPPLSARQPRTMSRFQPRQGPTPCISDQSVVLDIRRQYSNDYIDISNHSQHHPWRRRPLNSHGPSRRNSADSNSSGSTVGPPTTNEDGEFITKPHIAHDSDSLDISPGHDRRSFIEFFSPTTPHFPSTSLPVLETDMLIYRSSEARARVSSSDKQALSSRPQKPIFSIPTLKAARTGPSSRSPSPRSSPSDDYAGIPPTTNFLDMHERADLVKKSRKLARVFGETPRGDIMAQQEPPRAPFAYKGSQGQPKKALVPRALDSEGLRQIQSSGRRHSIPVTPDELSESFNQVLLQSAPYKARLCMPTNDQAGCLADGQNKHSSRTSFIDLSDEEDMDDAVSAIHFAPNVAATAYRPGSPSLLSLYEAMTPEERAEEEKRRKREKLAKLHRFLGSRVPADLVLGVAHQEASLPLVQAGDMLADEDDIRSSVCLRKRRSSSAGDLPSWSDDLDRMREELNHKEKALNVRRAHKMEKMFGVAPPQTLYHTRHSPSPSVPAAIYMKRSKSPPLPSFGGFIAPGEVPSPTYQQRNPNRSSYIKQKPKKSDRPSTAESSMRLLPEGQDCYDFDNSSIPQGGLRTSLIYHHYQHSLKSLGDILDRDDKESLAELHQYLNDYEGTAGSPPLREIPLTKDRRLSNASSIKSERRRSLPARTSMLSLASEFTIATPKPETTDFQLRRRRAAKLTQFFGVNYRELINDVLESLENGLEHERRRGTLQAEEIEDLLERLRKIKTNRKGFF